MLLIEAGLVKPLLNPWAEMTVFAPSDAAFAAIGGADALTTLTANPAALEAVLKMHVVDGAFTTADFYDGQRLETAAGTELTVRRAGDTIDLLAPGDDGTVATIALGDVDACGSVLHMVDAVLVPGADVVVVTGPGVEHELDRAAAAAAAEEDDEDAPGAGALSPPLCYELVPCNQRLSLSPPNPL